MTLAINTTDAFATGTISNTGNNVPFNNYQPSTAIRYIIALQGTYPSRN